MKKILVLGIGNRLMMDDGIGLYLVEHLQEQLISAQLEFVVGEADIYYCLSVLAGAKQVIVIDAFLAGKQPGELSIIPIGELKNEQRAGYSAHGIHVLDILQVLDNKLEGVLLGIEPQEINYGTKLSAALQNSYSAIYQGVYDYVHNLALLQESKSG